MGWSFLRLIESVRLPVEVFECAEAFLQAFDPNRPGCLLLDVRMPGMGGLRFLDWLRSQGAYLKNRGEASRKHYGKDGYALTGQVDANDLVFPSGWVKVRRVPSEIRYFLRLQIVLSLFPLRCRRHSAF
jgi:CheY-like chemotaxis protein